ncbi:Calcipressin-domain-containing protein, partial [Gorgonomyces haynaldii]
MQPLETNTLIFTNLSEQTFQDNGKLLLKWLPVKPQQLVLLSSFGRILCVFARTVDAREIKKRHKQILDGCSIGIYYGLPYAEPGPERYLQVPELQRNFLLSPPGSPPVGWVQTHEKPPISEDEIASAFSHVSLADFTLDGGRLVDLD